MATTGTINYNIEKIMQTTHNSVYGTAHHDDEDNGVFAHILNTSTFTTNLNDDTDVPKKPGFMSDEVRTVIEVINVVIIAGIISLFGVIANIVNIIVFLRQGLTDSINVSLFGLAVSDSCVSIACIMMGVFLNPLFAESGIPFNSLTVQYIATAWPFGCFARISSFITAYITFERCLCIVIPLKVKAVLTPRRSFVVIVCIYLMIMASVSPVYFAMKLGWVFNEKYNRSLLDLVYTENGDSIENFSLFFNSFTLLTSFVLVSIFSLFLVNGLREKSRWRKKASVDGSSSSARDDKIVKMVLTFATVFIVCYFPTSIQLILNTTSKEYSIIGRYQNMFQTVWSFCTVFQTTNSAVNIFIYVRMSSKYRHEFRKLFGLASLEDDK